MPDACQFVGLMTMKELAEKPNFNATGDPGGFDAANDDDHVIIQHTETTSKNYYYLGNHAPDIMTGTDDNDSYSLQYASFNLSDNSWIGWENEDPKSSEEWNTYFTNRIYRKAHILLQNDLSYTKYAGGMNDLKTDAESTTVPSELSGTTTNYKIKDFTATPVGVFDPPIHSTDCLCKVEYTEGGSTKTFCMTDSTKTTLENLGSVIGSGPGGAIQSTNIIDELLKPAQILVKDTNYSGLSFSNNASSLPLIETLVAAGHSNVRLVKGGFKYPDTSTDWTGSIEIASGKNVNIAANLHNETEELNSQIIAFKRGSGGTGNEKLTLAGNNQQLRSTVNIGENAKEINLVLAGEQSVPGTSCTVYGTTATANEVRADVGTSQVLTCKKAVKGNFTINGLMNVTSTATGSSLNVHVKKGGTCYFGEEHQGEVKEFTVGEIKFTTSSPLYSENQIRAAHNNTFGNDSIEYTLYNYSEGKDTKCWCPVGQSYSPGDTPSHWALLFPGLKVKFNITGYPSWSGNIVLAENTVAYHIYSNSWGTCSLTELWAGTKTSGTTSGIFILGSTDDITKNVDDTVQLTLS